MNTSDLFNYTISNPPYQLDVSNDRQTTARGIYHLFYSQGQKLSERSIMIFPGGRWMQRGGSGLRAADVIIPTVSCVDWFPNGDEKNIQKVFPGVRLKDGVSVTAVDNETSNVIIHNGVVYPRPDAQGILPLSALGSRIVEELLSSWDTFLSSRKQPMGVFGLPGRFVEMNHDKVRKTPAYGFVRGMVANDTPGTSKRVEEFYIDKSALDWNDRRKWLFTKFKVCSSAGHCGKDPMCSKMVVVGEDTVIGDSWVILGVFDTEEEAYNYKRYIDTPFVRFLLGESKGAGMKKWGYFVPDLMDYTMNNPVVDFKASDDKLEKQILRLFTSEYVV